MGLEGQDDRIVQPSDYLVGLAFTYRLVEQDMTVL